jgi:hypothetical protein
MGSGGAGRPGSFAASPGFFRAEHTSTRPGSAVSPMARVRVGEANGASGPLRGGNAEPGQGAKPTNFVVGQKRGPEKKRRGLGEGANGSGEGEGAWAQLRVRGEDPRAARRGRDGGEVAKRTEARRRSRPGEAMGQLRRGKAPKHAAACSASLQRAALGDRDDRGRAGGDASLTGTGPAGGCRGRRARRLAKQHVN